MPIQRQKTARPDVHAPCPQTAQLARQGQGASDLPWLSMPHNGRKIFFWKTNSQASVEPTAADKLQSVEIALARLRQEFQKTHTCGEASLKTLQATYDALAKLLHRLDLQDAELAAIRDELVVAPGRLLASWRVTEREILATDATALKEDLDALFQAVRRAHVDLAGALIERR